MTAPADANPTERRAFLFTDIEDSTALWEQYPQGMTDAAARLDDIVSEAVRASGGRVLGRTGDAIDAVFDGVVQAATAAARAQRQLSAVDWGAVGRLRVRMAIDAGEVVRREGHYYGPVLNRLGRILAAGHGGQVLLSADAHQALPAGGEFETKDLGEHRFKGIGRPQPIFQLIADDLAVDFPPLRSGAKPTAPRRRAEPRTASIRGYELRQTVGTGDFGVVYLAVQTSVGREVAVKIIRPEYANQPEFVRRFEAEAQFIAQLEHPHIVTLFDFWRDPDGAYLVMSYLRGGSLADALRRGPWHVEPALGLLDQIGSALSYAHRQGVIHRDVKPGNVLLDEDGHGYLSDFGIASRVTDAASGLMTTSLSYVPPEELRGERLDPRSDVFSLAVLTFELLTGTQPAGRDLPALIANRADLPAGLPELLGVATREQPSERHGTVDDYIHALREVLAPVAGMAAARVSPVRPAAAIRNPYKGLRPFRETDAADFYGREALTEELVAAVGGSRLVGVVGASGSGKSSVVRAGLLPAVRRGALPGSQQWLITEMYPGSYPFEELEAALLRVAVRDPGALSEELRRDERGLLRVVKRVLPDDDSELVLLIDQFEELFSLGADEAARQLFLDALAILATDERSRVRLVLTLRADFFDRPLDHPAFGQLFKSSLVAVTAPTHENLEEAISRPARNVGLELEPGLVQQVVADVEGEPGGLPLLQYALTELFGRREGDQLTIAAYRESGGVVGALARRAEAVYDSLPDDVRDVARQVFLRLVTLGEGVEDTRRRVRRRELTALPGGSGPVEHVLDAFGAHRLLSFDHDASTREPTVEIAHEALLRHWQRLRRWVDEARDDLRQQRRLQQAAVEWREAGEDRAYLLPPDRVADTATWMQAAQIALSADEVRFLEASTARKIELEAAEAERLAHEQALERRAVNRLRAVAVVLAIGIVAAGALAVLALGERNRADEQRAAAEEQRARAEEQQALAEQQQALAEEQQLIAEQQERVATAREFAAAALGELNDDPERSILLALEAVEETRDVDGSVMPEAEAALRTAIRASHLMRTLATGGGISLAPDGRLATLGVDGAIAVWDAAAAERLWQIDGGQTGAPVRYAGALASLEPDDLDFSHDGRRIVVADAQFNGFIRDAETGDVLGELQELILRPRFSPDGMRVAGLLLPTEPSEGSNVAGVVGVWDAESGEVVHRLQHQESVFDYAFSPAGGHLAVTTFGPSHVWELDTGEEVWSLTAGNGGGSLAVGYSPDGEQVVFGALDGTIVFRAAADGAPLRTFRGHDAPAQGGVAFSADGSRIVTVGQLDVRVWDVATERQLFLLAGHASVIRDVAISPDGTRVYTSSQDGETRIWDVSVVGGVEYDVAPALVGPTSTWSDFSPDGRHLATSTPDGEVSVFELETMEVVQTFSTADATHMSAYSGDGSRLATSSAHGFFELPENEWRDEVEVWDTGTSQRVAAFDNLPEAGWDLAINHDGSLVAWVAGAHLSILDVASSAEIVSQTSSDADHTRVLFTPEGNLFVGGAFGGKIINPRTGETLVELQDEVPIWDADVTQDGVLVTGGRGEGGFQLWDPRSGQPLHRFPGQAILASVSVWEHLVATGHDNSLAVRELASGELRFSVDVPTQLIRVRISPDGRYLLANHSSEGMHLFVLPMEDLLELARSRVTRTLSDAECEEFLRLPSCPDE